MNENNLDDLRHQWQALSTDNARLSEANRLLVAKLAAEKATTKQQKLKRQYLVFAILGFVLLPFLAYVGLYEMLHAPLWLCLLYAGGGFYIGVMDLWFVSLIGSADYISMPTCEAMAHASRMLLWQARLQALGIVACVIIVGPLLVYIYCLGKPDVMIGALVGLGVGLVFGILKYNSLRRMARSLLSDLES